jgi:3-hydroxyisobutyrate dehydrogenase
MVGLAEGFLYAREAGLDFDKLFESIAEGAAGSWSLSNYGPRIVNNDFAPGFMVDHFIKDMRLAVEQGRARGIMMPGTELALELYTLLSKSGHGRDGTQSLVHEIAAESGLEW